MSHPIHAHGGGGLMDLGIGPTAVRDRLQRCLERSPDNGSQGELARRSVIEEAGAYARALFVVGTPVADVARGYGEIFGILGDLDGADGRPLVRAELRRVHRRIEAAMAVSVTEYGRLERESLGRRSDEQIGGFAHEVRNLLENATLSFVNVTSALDRTAHDRSVRVHNRSLTRLGQLVHRILDDLRRTTRIRRFEQIDLADFVDELVVIARSRAAALGRRFDAGGVLPVATFEGEREVLAAVIGNLLHNAFKFSRPGGCVAFRTRLSGDRLVFEVEGECGGLPSKDTEALFQPFTTEDRTAGGLGMGLAICRAAARDHGGEIHASNLPGKGCIFALALPLNQPVV